MTAIRAGARRWARGAPLVMAALAWTCTVGSCIASAASLPDGRAYEMVSPVDKAFSDVSELDPITGVTLATAYSAVDGDRVVFGSQGAFAGAPAAAAALTGIPYAAQRTSNGWTTTPVMPASTNPFASLSTGFVQFDGMSTDGQREAYTQPPDTAAGYDGAVFVNEGSGPPQQIMTIPASLPGAAIPYFDGGSKDLSHAVFDVGGPMIPDDTVPAGKYRVYAWDWDQQALKLVSVLSDGTPAAGMIGRGVYNVTAPGWFHVVSNDGSRIFFTTSNSFSAGGVVHVRLNGTTTVDISTPRGTGVTPGSEGAYFQAATPDGSVAFITSHNQLTTSAPAGVQAGNVYNLYRYDLPTDTLTYETTLKNVSGSNKQIVLAVSADGSRIYLGTQTQLVAGAGDPTSTNLYLWQDGQAHYVGTAAPSDGYAAFAGGTGGAPLNVTPDGSKLAFLSSKQLTTYDSGGHAEVYVYDAATGNTVCTSCPPDGSPATSDARLYAKHHLSVQTEASSITADGSRVFFDTTDALVPQDVNNHRDVYEYVDGAARLISSGAGSSDSVFLEVTPSGRDAFFLTRDNLVEGDVDGGFMDVYDARIGGGFPVGPKTAPCSGDSCRSAPSSQPDQVNPASESFFAPVDSPPTNIPALSVGKISQLARSRLMSTGRLTLLVKTGSAGVITATARGRIGDASVTVARATRRVSGPGSVHLELRLTNAARRQLARGRALAIRLQVGMSGVHSAQTATLTLRPAKQAASQHHHTRAAKTRLDARKEAR
jgi:hypothetical protein